MLRHGVRRAASQITLEFLLPTTLKHSKTCLIASYRTATKLASPHLTPQLSSALEKIPLPPKDLESLRDVDATLYNETIPQLARAFAEHNIMEVWKIWSFLADRQFLRLYGPAQCDMYSRQLTAICNSRGEDNPLTAEERNAVEHIALFLAGGAYTLPLKICMLHYIRKKDSDAVHKLYAQYLGALQSKVSWKETESYAKDPLESAEEEAEVQGDQPSNLDFGASISRPVQQPPNKPPAAQDETDPPVRQEILLCEIAAYALKDDLRGALHAVLESGVRVSYIAYGNFLRGPSLPSSLRRRIWSWEPRLGIGRLLSRNYSLTVQLANLIRDHANKSLERLYNGIIEELSNPDPWVTTKPSEVSERKPVLMPEFAWVSFLRGFLECRELNLAQQLWDDMNRFGVTPTVAVWTALIDGYASLRMADSADKAWKIMHEQGIKPDALAFRALIFGMFHSGLPDMAMMRFREFEQAIPRLSERDEDPILVVHNTVLHGLLFHAKVDEANKVLKKMQEHGPKPDIVSFNTFMRYHGRQGDYKAFASVLHQLDEHGLVGDEFTFSTLLTTLLKVRKDATEIMFGLMKKQGIQPNVAMYTSIIGHQVKQQTMSDFQAALDILQKMEQDESGTIQPNEITYTTFLTGTLRVGWLEAATAEEWIKDITERMRRRNITPKRATYHLLFRACLDNPEHRGVQNALWYYRDMMERRVVPDNSTWYILISGLMRRGERELAMELVDDVGRAGFVPSASLYNLMSEVKGGKRRLE